MSIRNRLPAPLESYLCLPPECSLVLLTSTLGCAATWLTGRFIGNLLSTPRNCDRDPSCTVLMVSWMRDARSWQDELKRLGGLEMGQIITGGKLEIVDCLTDALSANLEKALEATESKIAQSIERRRGEKIVLVLDYPDTLLAMDMASASQTNEALLRLRAKVYATIVITSADLPLMAAASPEAEGLLTPIEKECAAFTAQLAHSARYVMSVRELETGAARDVSGVLRVTRGGDAYGTAESEGDIGVSEMEALYLVQRDGSAKVFARGSSPV